MTFIYTLRSCLREECAFDVALIFVPFLVRRLDLPHEAKSATTPQVRPYCSVDRGIISELSLFHVAPVPRRGVRSGPDSVTIVSSLDGGRRSAIGMCLQGSKCIYTFRELNLKLA